DDLVGMAGLDAWQGRSHVDLMDHYLEIDAVAGIGIDGLDIDRAIIAAGTMAQHTESYFAACASMSPERVVALVAGNGVDHIMDICHGRCVRREREYGIRNIGAELECCEIP